MGADRGKPKMVTFKADTALVEAMQGIQNRSEFIRGAILAALDSACPLCHGTGVLNPNQRQHWDEFKENHCIVTCDECNEGRLVCVAREKR